MNILLLLLKMTILIVDDSVFFREKLKKAIYCIDNNILFLEELSFEGGEYAVSYHKPELVILEIELQGKSGIKLLKEIRSLSISTTVILFTHHLSEEFKSICLENGADYFFDKCKNYPQVLEVINNLVKQHAFQ